jgi:hypothetical protein
MWALLRANRLVRLAVIFSVLAVLLLAVLGVLLVRIGRAVREDSGLQAHGMEITAAFERLLTDFADTAEARVAVGRIRPHPEEGLVTFIRGLEIAAARAAVEQNITAFPGVASAGQDGYPSPFVRYRVAVSGPWVNAEAYLKELVALQNLVRVESVQMETGPDGDLFAKSEVTVVFAVAVLPPSAPRPSP